MKKITDLRRNMSTTTNRTIRVIAMEIRNDWGAKLSPHAKPYLDAMASLSKITDNYYEDSGVSIVSYFLANAGTWRGETARRVKKELNAMIKESRK